MTTDVPYGFEILEHTADVGFRARGATVVELFQHAADAFLFIACDRAEVHDDDAWPVVVDGDDLPSLLVNFLEEILFLFDAGRFATARVTVDEVTGCLVRARLHGEPRDPARHPWKLIVKAVTYHGLEVGEHGGRWEARVYMDV